MKDFKKYYTLAASPQDVYNALTTPVTLELWTGESAAMSTQPGSEFSLWGGSIVGKNLEFELGRKIIQEWYFGEQRTASIVTITLHPPPTLLAPLEATGMRDPDARLYEVFRLAFLS